MCIRDRTINTSFSGLGSLLLELQRGMNFYGLKLYEVPTTDINIIKANLGLYIPLFALIIVATIITFISSKLSMVSMNKRNNHHKNDASNKLAVSYTHLTLPT